MTSKVTVPVRQTPSASDIKKQRINTPDINPEKKMLDDLEHLLKKGYKDAGIAQLPENYFNIEDILNLPIFKMFSWTDMRTAVHSDGQLRFSVRGNKIRLKPPELNKDRAVIISKKLAWILRHGAEKEGFTFEDGGFIYMDDMLKLDQFKEISVSEIYEIVDSNEKKRFEIREHPKSKRLQIRAVQGHSVKVEGLDLRLIEDPLEFPTVIHGTYFRNLTLIKTGGLKRMGRQHIHFAVGEVGDEGVISGMRASAEILIAIDMGRAMKAGLKFYISTNGVILCEGDETGCIETKYFKEVLQRRPSKRCFALSSS